MTKKELSPREKLILQELQKRKATVLKEILQINDEITEIVRELDLMDQADGQCVQTSSKEKMLTIGKKKFNINVPKGLEYLIKNELLNNAAQDIAKFLFNSEGLNKVKIGEYLGDTSQMHLDVLKAFVQLHDFEN